MFSLKHEFLQNYRKNKQLQNVGMAVRNFILLATLLGLTWIFGFLPVMTQRYMKLQYLILAIKMNAHLFSVKKWKFLFFFSLSDEMNLAAQWLFVIINGSLGIYIFINGVLLNKQVCLNFLRLEYILLF